jgi:hypothetical protein
MPTIVDLDVLAGKDREVRLGGKVYALPGDIPLDLYAKLASFRDRDTDDAEAQDTAAVEIYEEMLALFRVRQPELERLPIGLTAAVRLIPLVYGSRVDEEEGGERPTRANGKASTRSTSPKKRSRSSSS